MRKNQWLLFISTIFVVALTVTEKVLASESINQATTTSTTNLPLTPVHYLLGGVLLVIMVVLIGVGIYLKQK